MSARAAAAFGMKNNTHICASGGPTSLIYFVFRSPLSAFWAAQSLKRPRRPATHACRLKVSLKFVYRIFPAPDSNVQTHSFPHHLLLEQLFISF